MRKYIVGLIVSLFLMGCNQDDVTPTANSMTGLWNVYEDYSTANGGSASITLIQKGVMTFVTPEGSIDLTVNSYPYSTATGKIYELTGGINALQLGDVQIISNDLIIVRMSFGGTYYAQGDYNYCNAKYKKQ